MFNLKEKLIKRKSFSIIDVDNIENKEYLVENDINFLVDKYGTQLTKKIVDTILNLNNIKMRFIDLRHLNICSLMPDVLYFCQYNKKDQVIFVRFSANKEFKRRIEQVLEMKKLPKPINTALFYE